MQKKKVGEQKLKKSTRKVRPLGRKVTRKSKLPLLPVHPWRVCPYGEHWVRTHSMNVPPSKVHPEGSITTRHQHCSSNPSGKDQLYPDEIRKIAQQHFSDLQNKPCPLNLDYGSKGSEYDDFITGWVQYWNEVFKPDVPLDPNLVKVLIASESTFNANKLFDKKNSNSARGLTQITNATRKLLGGSKGGLKDHLITVTKDDLNDPGTNICAGVRWLFEKRRLASSSLKRTASWVEAVWEYKGLRLASKVEATKIKNIFNRLYEEYQKCGKA